MYVPTIPVMDRLPPPIDDVINRLLTGWWHAMC